MLFSVSILLISAFCITYLQAECPNACSAHGKCGSYDMCTCYRNWMANDCSERICQFGLAHVDTPKGDLDASSGALSGPSVTVVVNDFIYPYGTTEQFPEMVDTVGNVLTNTAHEYRECSNKGICDRSTGTCACFEGYDGSACQRASCPTNSNGVCSGHGVCNTIQEIADNDFNNVYELWDKKSTMGCVCDGGYTGSDCSERICKYGVDPLYFDSNATMRYSNFTYQIYSLSSTAILYGNYSLVFYDAAGDDWHTSPISTIATCADVTLALESLPNNVIPSNSVRCFKSEVKEGGPLTDSNKNIYVEYTLAFTENPGRLPQMDINKYLDGTRPTLFTDETTSTLSWNIYPNGFIGEYVDMVPDLCEGVTVTLHSDVVTHYLGGLTVQTAKDFKRCLGDSDGYAGDNVEVYNWDYGNISYPHLIKLVDNTQNTVTIPVDANGDYVFDQTDVVVPKTQLCTNSVGNPALFGEDSNGIGYCSNANPPGFFAVLYYDATNANPFRIYTRAAHDYSSTTPFSVYTTTGFLQLVNYHSAAFTMTAGMTTAQKANSHYTSLLHLTNYTNDYPGYHGAVDCDTQTVGVNGLVTCLNKDDYVMVLPTSPKQSATQLAANPIYPNMYQVKKVGLLNLNADLAPNTYRNRLIMQLDYSMNSDLNYNGGNASSIDTSGHIYKFNPPASLVGGVGYYDYVGECSNRGICDTDSGLCQCFKGYTSDDCSMINALAA